MKRLVSIALLMSMLLASAGITSCGGSASPAETTVGTEATTSAEETTASLVDQLGAKDFGGREFNIFSINIDNSFQMTAGDELTGDIINDALYERDAGIGELYNVKINNIVEPDRAASSQIIINSVLAGDMAYDLLFGNIKSGLDTPATSGALTNLLELPHLQLESEWWSRLMAENLTLGGKLYYTTGDIVPTLYQLPACVFMNNNLASKYKIDDNFFAIVKDGKWTLDVLKESVKDCDSDLNQDGVMKSIDDFFGFLNQNHSLAANCFIVGSGLPLIQKSSDGSTFKVDFLGEKYLKVIDKLAEVVSTQPDTENRNNCTEYFKQKRAIFYMHFVESTNALRDMDDDYSILPVPKLDESQDSYRSMVNAWIPAFVAAPQTADAELTGFIAEAMARWSYEKIRPLAYETTYKDKYTRNQESADVLDILFESVYLDFQAIYDFGTTSTILGNAIFLGQPLASSLAAASGNAESAINNFVKGWTTGNK